MTREEIIKALRHCASAKDCRECVLASLKVSTGRCERILQNAAADMLEQDAPGWISVKNRLPEDSERVLAYFPEMRDSESDIQLSKGWAVNKFVSHWMPLPEPPKEEAHD